MRITEALKKKKKVYVVYVTYGDHMHMYTCEKEWLGDSKRKYIHLWYLRVGCATTQATTKGKKKNLVKAVPFCKVAFGLYIVT